MKSMHTSTVRLGLLASSLVSINAYTWPDPKTDFLEALYYQQNGNNAFQFGVLVKSCDFGDNLTPPGRKNSAEWIRTAYHDMATADVDAGTGGLDASIGFELDRPENTGKALTDTIKAFLPAMSSRSSMADLIALGAIMSVTACTINNNGSPQFIPFRGGRVDATSIGPAGVPQPQEDLATHTTSFKKQGFSQSEMIALVACGHSVGGVNGVDFPEIVDVVNDPSNGESKQSFDATVAALDNSVATQFLENSTQNALAFGHNVTTRSDLRIFNSDGGDMIHKMAASNDFFISTCTDLLQRMVDTVPKDVKLTEPINAIPVKPDNIDIALDANGNMVITGDLRIIDVFPTPPGPRKILVHFKARSGSASPVTIEATRWGPPGSGVHSFAPSFQWWRMSASIPVQQGSLPFTIEVIDGGVSTMYSNGGNGFLLQTDLILQSSASCASNHGGGMKLTVTAAVRDDAMLSSVKLQVPVPLEQQGSIIPRFETTTVEMRKGQSVGATGYTLYSGTFQIIPKKFFSVLMSYGVSASGQGKTTEAPFQLWRGMKEC